ncbi:RidA family protein [Actinokineospora pegani]|uniref:RidA family protein n=1 Tax=Actinokineospora pegani TaxID=2654637 RepID=UPI0012E99C98|nr:Rid family hydrolase [Actinokineospora pegani]
MAVTLVNPRGLPESDLYHQVSVSTGSRTVHVAGQVSWDADGAHLHVGDLAAQVEQVYRNAATALASVGATFDDAVRLTFHVVRYEPAMMSVVAEGIARGRAAVGATTTPPASLFGTPALDVPEHLVELEVVAVLD